MLADSVREGRLSHGKCPILDLKDETNIGSATGLGDGPLAPPGPTVQTTN